MVSTAISAASTFISKGIYNDHGTEKHHAASTFISKGIYNRFYVKATATLAASTLISKGVYNL